MTKLFLDILDHPRKDVFKKLQLFSEEAVLGGGTALALQIGHRRSFDFDLFFDKPIQEQMYQRLMDLFGEAPKKLVDAPNQLSVALSAGIEVTCLYYWYPPFHPVVTTESVPLLAIEDIASAKAFALGRRNVWRDYVDFYFLFKKGHVVIDSLLVDCVRRFGNEFSGKLFLEQLVYTADIHDLAVSFVGTPVSRSETEQYLSEIVHNYLRNHVLL